MIRRAFDLRLWSVGCLIWLIGARVLGPSDVFDVAQPRTVSYTTDMLVNGHWLLPHDRGLHPATKPPLYNWLATPAVAIGGFGSVLAHKFPSLLALAGCWGLLVWSGQRLDRPSGRLGWLAGLVFVANHSVMKLGYLARPDMLLAFWVLGGWYAANRVVEGMALGAVGDAGTVTDTDTVAAPAPASRGFLWPPVFWLCVALAAMTKGPPAVILVAYALLLPRLVGGRWRDTLRFGWWWGLPLAVLPFGVWLWAVYQIDSRHLIEQLWQQEVYGRVTGLGEEGVTGPSDLVRRLAHMPLYWLSRFAPWSLLAILAVVGPWSLSASEVAKTVGPGMRRWLWGGVVLVVLVIVVFTPSAGKRADYVVPAFGPAALLVAWWLLRTWPLVTRWLVPALVTLIMTTVTVRLYRQVDLSSPGVAHKIADCLTIFDEHLSRAPRPVVFWNIGDSHLQAFLGYNQPDGPFEVHQQAELGEAFWLIRGGRTDLAPLNRWLKRASQPMDIVVAREVERCQVVGCSAWLPEITLYEVLPVAQEAVDNSIIQP